MKKLMILCMVLAFLCACWALAEEAAEQPAQESAELVNLDGIDLIDMGTTGLETETEIGEALSMTVHQPSVETSWRSLLADSRNQYLVVPVTVMNLELEDVNVLDTVRVTLNYKKYSFEPERVVAADEPDSIVGEWIVYESDCNNKVMNEFPCVIRSVDANGKVNMTWAKTEEKNATWNEKLQVLFMNSNQCFRYQNGVLAGGGYGNRFRSVLIRTKPITASSGSSVLGMLEEATFQYAFKCPNTVISHLGDCVLTVEAAGQRLTIELDPIEPETTEEAKEE